VFLDGGEGEAVVTAEIWIERWRSRRSDRLVPDPQAAMLFVAGVAVLFFWAGSQLQLWLGERGLLAAEWLLLFVPSVLVVSLYGFDPVRTLSLQKPSGLGVLGSVLLIMGAVPLVWFIGWIQTFIFPVPWELLEGLEDLVTADTMGRLVWLLLLLAVTPAVCEEILFRGVLLGGTRTLQPWRMIVLNGVVFGAFHLSFETAIRLGRLADRFHLGGRAHALPEQRRHRRSRFRSRGAETLCDSGRTASVVASSGGGGPLRARGTYTSATPDPCWG
jgi:sodium transport system permease protein